MSGKKTCPFCKEEIQFNAVKCKHCASWVDNRKPVKDWYRSYSMRKIAGVCSGLSIEFSLPVTLIRVLFVIGLIFGGWGFVVYLALWMIMPWHPENAPASHTVTTKTTPTTPVPNISI